jgi:uncharacterized lipoprotein
MLRLMVLASLVMPPIDIVDIDDISSMIVVNDGDCRVIVNKKDIKDNWEKVADTAWEYCFDIKK